MDVYNEIGNVMMSLQRKIDEAIIEARDHEQKAADHSERAKSERACAGAYKDALDELSGPRPLAAEGSDSNDVLGNGG